MPTTTRSKTQPKPENGNVNPAKSSLKRKAPESKASAPSGGAANKKAKTIATKNGKKSTTTKATEAKPKDESEDETKDAKAELMKNAEQQKDNVDSGSSVMINRAPVLELWAACVASFTHPDLSWAACLSVGSAISSITAIAKGRSIGAIGAPGPTGQGSKQGRKGNGDGDDVQDEQDPKNEVRVMQFRLKVEDDAVLVGDKPKKANEETLKKKYGEEDYEKVKTAMQDALLGWKGKEDELNERAFHMYEDFRPSVATGQKGWGRKGELNLGTVKNVASNE